MTLREKLDAKRQEIRQSKPYVPVTRFSYAMMMAQVVVQHFKEKKKS